MGESNETHEVPHVDQKKKDDYHHRCLQSLKNLKHQGVVVALVFYVVLGVICVLAALAQLLLTATAIVLTKEYDSEATGRITGSIVLIISVAVAAASVIYGIVVTCKKKNKPLKVVSTILVLLVIVQILLIAFSVHFKREDDLALVHSMTKSFENAHDKQNHTDIVLWNNIQSSFNCCGLHGPDDYRDPDIPIVPPNVPFSCCPTYKENQTDGVNKWKRDLCIMNDSYYKRGCLAEATTVFKGVMWVTVKMVIGLIFLEVLVLLIGFYLSDKHCELKHEKKQLEAVASTRTSAEA